MVSMLRQNLLRLQIFIFFLDLDFLICDDNFLKVTIKWVYEILSHKTAGKDGKDKLFSIQFAMYHLAEVRHAVFVAMIVGGSATPETTYSIIGIDFLINIFNCYKIIRKHRLGIEGTFNSIQTKS